MHTFLKFAPCYVCLILASVLKAESALDPPEIMLGERLFLETRFAQYFKIHLEENKNINNPLIKGDPALEKTVRSFGLPPYQIPFTDGPYAGQSFNCRTCHLVDEHVEQNELGMRSYSDFASRSPLPTRNDGQVTTVRNAPALVDASLARENFFMHFDGEFPSLLALVEGTLSNRNFGWLPGEYDIAVAHICKVLREDDGKSELAKEFGGYSYTQVFVGVDKHNKQLPEEYLLPKNLRMDIRNSNCDEVFTGAANLIALYTADLVFAQDESIISPYDLFLLKNNLPSRPKEEETDIDYSLKLLSLINQLEQKKQLQFVNKNPNSKNGGFQFHDQPFQFGPQQLAGMKIFLNQDKQDNISTGNCIACHAAPHFTDFALHNTGITQVEFDALHGSNAFNNLHIPDLAERNKNADYFLPATHKHPKRKGIFRRTPSEASENATDLGAWNVLFNEDYPKVQEVVKNALCTGNASVCNTNDGALNKSIATFKTPSLRNLGHSAPYMHNGQINDLHAIIAFYISTSEMSRRGLVRNSDEEISNIEITAYDIKPLVLFLISLYEDYH